MGDIDNELDCSFLCNNVEKENSCDLFAFEDQKCYFGSSGESKGLIENDLANATIYVTKGNMKFHLFLKQLTLNIYNISSYRKFRSIDNSFW